MITSRLLKNTPGCPKANWTWHNCIDLKEDEGFEFDEYEDCEFCGQEKIRYVHELTHTDWPQVIRVGRICAARYTATSPAELERHEAILKNRSQRRQRFPKLKAWKTSTKGNSHIDYLDHHILVVRRQGGFGLKIDSKWGTMTFPSERDAMFKAYDVVTKRARSHKACDSTT